MHRHFRFSVRAQRHGADVDDRTLKEIAALTRIALPAEQIRSASTLPLNAHNSTGSARRVPAPTRKDGTSPRNQLPRREATVPRYKFPGREEPEGKQKQP